MLPVRRFVHSREAQLHAPRRESTRLVSISLRERLGTTGDALDKVRGAGENALPEFLNLSPVVVGAGVALVLLPGAALAPCWL
ncbi:MAG: hypothetical protein ACLPVY_27885 [Acidimicrobiia bacterium]